jgi:hypothetical protein
MKKVFDYILAYILWIVEIGFALYFCYISRTLVLGIMTFYYKVGNVQYQNRMNLTDRVFVLILGFGWLIFMIFVEEYFRSGVSKGNLPKRIVGVTWPVLLAAFLVDLVLLWIQGFGSGSWLHWLVLAVELGAGVGLLMFAKTRFTSKTN